MQLLDFETEFDRLSAARPLKLIVTQVTNSSEEEEEGMDLKQRTGLKGVKGSFYVSFSKKEVGPGASRNGFRSTILPLPGFAQILSPSPREDAAKWAYPLFLLQKELFSSFCRGIDFSSVSTAGLTFLLCSKTFYCAIKLLAVQ